jgi:uncharacterized protein (DUF885 family)
VTARAAGAPAFASALRPPAAALAALLLACGPARAGSAVVPAPARLARLADEYRTGLLADRPDLAFRLGDRRGEDRLEPVTQASLAREATRLRALAARLDSIPRDSLPPAAALERDSLAARIGAALHELEVTRRWERDPAAYLDLAGDAIAALLERGTGPTCGRARAMARRLTRVPDVLRAARVNLREPPRARVEQALPGYEHLLRFYREGLAPFAARCREARTQADLAEADTAAVRAVEAFLDYLRQDLLPRAPAGPDAGPGPEAPGGAR